MLKCSQSIFRKFQARDHGASQWRKTSFRRVVGGMPNIFGGRVTLHPPSSMTSSSHLPLTIDVSTSDEVTLQLLRLHFFGMVVPRPHRQAQQQPQSVDRPEGMYRRLYTSCDSLPNSVGHIPPAFLEHSVDYFRRMRAQKRRESMMRSTAITKVGDTISSAIYPWEAAMDKSYNHHRWSFGTLQDGFLAMQVKDHPLLERTVDKSELECAKMLRLELQPLEKSLYFASNDIGSEWCVFGRSAVSHAEKERALLDALELVFSSCALRDLKAVRLRGDAIMDRRTGDTVVILGPANSGKTSLALHCMAAHPELAFVGSGTVCLYPCNDERGLGQMRVAALPCSPEVKLGTLLGTLHPNRALERLVPEDVVASVSEVSKNSLETIWSSFSQQQRVHIAEAFGGKDRCGSGFSGNVKGIVFLGWNTKSLPSPQRKPLGIAANRMNGDDFKEMLLQLDGADSVFATHPLLEWTCARGDDLETRMTKRLEEMLGCEGSSSGSCQPIEPLDVLVGDVDFAKATRYVLERILHVPSQELDGVYQRSG